MPGRNVVTTMASTTTSQPGPGAGRALRYGAAPSWGTPRGSILAAACPHAHPDTLLCTQLPLPEVALTTAPLDRRPCVCCPTLRPQPGPQPRGPLSSPSPLSAGQLPSRGTPDPWPPMPLQTVWSLHVHSVPAASCPLLSPSPRVLRPVPLGTLPGGPPRLYASLPRRRPVPAASCRAGPSPGPQGCPCVVTRECPSLIGGCHWEAGALTGHICHLMSVQSGSAEALG